MNPSLYGGKPVMDIGIVFGSGIDGLPSQGQRIGLVPPRHGILTDFIVGNVRVQAILVFTRAAGFVSWGWAALTVLPPFLRSSPVIPFQGNPSHI